MKKHLSFKMGINQDCWVRVTRKWARSGYLKGEFVVRCYKRYCHYRNEGKKVKRCYKIYNGVHRTLHAAMERAKTYVNARKPAR